MRARDTTERVVRSHRVARRLRVGRAEGRCLAAWRKRGVFLSVKPGTACHLRAPIVH